MDTIKIELLYSKFKETIISIIYHRKTFIEKRNKYHEG